MEQDITRLLIEWRQGREGALDALLPLVYDELRRIASRQMARERDGHTLQPTALVHEAWMQLAKAAGLDLKDRAHFLAIAARAMRQILVQHARRTNAEKRGAGVTCVELKDDLEVADAAPAIDCDLLALDDALVKLAAQDQRKNHVVELKYFGGLTDKEIADVLGVAAVTVRRDLKVAHAFLLWQITGSASQGGV